MREREEVEGTRECGEKTEVEDEEEETEEEEKEEEEGTEEEEKEEDATEDETEGGEEEGGDTDVLHQQVSGIKPFRQVFTCVAPDECAHNHS